MDTHENREKRKEIRRKNRETAIDTRIGRQIREMIGKTWKEAAWKGGERENELMDRHEYREEKEGR